MLASLLLNEPVAVDPSRAQRDYEKAFEAAYDALQDDLRKAAQKDASPGVVPGPAVEIKWGDEDEDEAIALILSLIRN